MQQYMTEQEILESFRNTMRHVAATVYAVTTANGDARFGIIATAVSSLSFDPPSLLVCINRGSSLHLPLETAENFCVNVLGLTNHDVAQAFMMASEHADRFRVGNWEDRHGVPVLANAQSSMICKTVDRHAFGTHSIFIGELVEVHHRENAKPLTYYDGNYIDISGAPKHLDV